MPPIFTEQWEREQQLREERRCADAARIEGVKRAKHTVVVYAWSEESSPPTIMEFQEGFTYPYFILTPTILNDLNINPSPYFNLYRHSLKVWTTVKAGHSVTIDNTASIFVKSSTIRTEHCQAFEASLRTAIDASKPLHFRHNFQHERAHVKSEILKAQINASRPKRALSSPTPSPPRHRYQPPSQLREVKTEPDVKIESQPQPTSLPRALARSPSVITIS
ncbi:hypothetical protein H0H92_013904, partial [Tricholoma furcatifolium]